VLAAVVVAFLLRWAQEFSFERPPLKQQPGACAHAGSKLSAATVGIVLDI